MFTFNINRFWLGITVYKGKIDIEIIVIFNFNMKKFLTLLQQNWGV